MAPVLKKYEAKYKEAKFEDTSKKTIDRPLVLAAYADLAPEWKANRRSREVQILHLPPRSEAICLHPVP